MSQKETTDPVGRLVASESPDQKLSTLAKLACQAYERKDAPECLELTREMLLIDPSNVFAQSMRILVQTRSDSPSAAPWNWNRTRWLVGAGVALAIGITGGVGLPRFMTESSPAEASPVASNASSISNLRVSADPVQQPVALPLEEQIRKVKAAAQRPMTGPVPPPVSLPARALIEASSNPAPAALPAEPVVAAPGGTLALSSPTTIDIYKDGAYFGSLPISLELPAGVQTLEYRHGNLRKIVTHVVNSNETTRAMITFDVDVQINSRPWATVSVDGVERRSLGQTPLGGVRVPIGSVLVFENPQFPAKRYRVTGNETGIQVVFP